MNTKLVALSILAVVAAAVASMAVAGPSKKPKQQRIVISATASGDPDHFVLRPRTPGPVKRDSGVRSACCWTQRFIVRDGQTIEIDDPLVTFTGKRGTFSYRARIAWLDAGNGYTIGTGTWKLVAGSGAYAHFKGHGRIASDWPAQDEISWQVEGYLGPR
jgi:hypothetical protein